MNNLSKNIKTRRLELGYTQDQIAEYLNVSTDIVDQYETDFIVIPVSVISELALLFNVEEYDLYRESPTQQFEVFRDITLDNMEMDGNDMRTISDFKKIVKNYINMVDILEFECKYRS